MLTKSLTKSFQRVGKKATVYVIGYQRTGPILLAKFRLIFLEAEALEAIGVEAEAVCKYSLLLPHPWLQRPKSQSYYDTENVTKTVILQRRKSYRYQNTKNVTKTKILKLLKYGKCYEDGKLKVTEVLKMLQRQYE